MIHTRESRLRRTCRVMPNDPISSPPTTTATGTDVIRGSIGCVEAGRTRCVAGVSTDHDWLRTGAGGPTRSAAVGPVKRSSEWPKGQGCPVHPSVRFAGHLASSPSTGLTNNPSAQAPAAMTLKRSIGTEFLSLSLPPTPPSHIRAFPPGSAPFSFSQKGYTPQARFQDLRVRKAQRLCGYWVTGR